MKEPKCIHRHTAKTHPNCFRKGLVKDTKENWWDGKKIGYFDIEVSDLRADWGYTLSWCLKERGKKEIASSVITKEEIFNYDFDKRVIRELVDALKGYDILVTFFGKPFDIKYVRTRAVYWGYEDFPAYGDLFHWDVYFHVKKNFKLGSNRLANVTQFLGIDGKTPLEPGLWMVARVGDKKALQYVLKHNEEDVKILERLHNRIGGFSKWIKTSI